MKYFFLILTMTIGLVGGYFLWSMKPTSNQLSINADLLGEKGEPQLGSAEETFPYVIPSGSTFGAALKNLDISPQDVHQLVVAAKPVTDLGRLNSGTRFQIYFSQNEGGGLNKVKVKLSAQEVLVISRMNNIWKAERIQKKVETRLVTFKGVVTSTLWESAAEAKMNPTLISDLAEVFAWQVDFAREVQEGDRWRLSVEEELINGEHVGWGSILSAEYVNDNDTYTAVLFRQEGKNVGYYSPEGASLKRVFLKSPIQYGRISSRFQRKRFHPVLKINRPHNGVDYAAPTGTPIRSVGDGTVEDIGFKGGGGNVIKIRHNSTYTTAYKHMSRFAKGMKRGARISQGQTIGYVGSTGLSSGPHLHFEFYVNGRYVDPFKQKFPNADPVSQSQLAEFTKIKNGFLSHLPNWDQAKAPVVDRQPSRVE